ncbi:amidohydrolase family protein [Streptomyces sp. NPDC002851]
MTIDIHGHITSPALFSRFPMPPSLVDVDGMIEQKEALGITTTVVGSPVGAGTMVPVPGIDNHNQPLGPLREFHDWLAETVRAHPDRLRAYAYVDPYGSDEALAHADELLGQGEFVGLIANTSAHGRFLDQPEADAFFALAAQHGAPVLLHPPAEPVGAASLRGHGFGLIEHVARPCDVTMGVAAIVFAGWLEKYPSLKLIASAAGGALPLLAEKLDLARGGPGGPGGPGGRGGPGGPGGPPGGRPPVSERVPEGPPPSQSLRRLYVDTGTPSRRQLAAALDVFGPEHLLFGTDSPPLTTPLDGALALIDGLELTPYEKDLVLDGNARDVFGLPAAQSAPTKAAVS